MLVNLMFNVLLEFQACARPSTTFLMGKHIFEVELDSIWIYSFIRKFSLWALVAVVGFSPTTQKDQFPASAQNPSYQSVK